MKSEPGCLDVTARAEADAVHVRLTGELDYDTTPEFLAAVRGILSGAARPRSLHLDCAGLGFCDTMGLSALLIIRRETGAAEIRLHLDNRPPALQRLLEVTGTLGYLDGAHPAASGGHGLADQTGRRTADTPPS